MPTPEERELAALADGSLPEATRRAAEQRVAASPELDALLAEQRRAVAAIRRVSVSAPPALRARIQAAHRRSHSDPRRRRWGVTVPIGALGAAAAVTGVLLALPSGGPGAPTVVAAATIALRPATGPAPTSRPEGRVLSVAAFGVPYPNWSRGYHWVASGTRVDRLGDRKTTTVFYRRGTHTLAYTIVSGPTLSWPTASRTVSENGVALHLFTVGGRNVVTWTRLGHSCVLSGAVSAPQLSDLAAWRGSGRVPF
jgi:anti-sigma factor RsiW